jgi:hypothetical protein
VRAARILVVGLVVGASFPGALAGQTEGAGAPEEGAGAGRTGAGGERLGATVRGNGFVLHYAPRDSLRAELIRAVLEEQAPLPALAPELPSGVTVILAPDESTFKWAAGGRPPDWSAAVAIPSLDRIVLPPGGSERIRPTSWLQVIRHEWAHLGLRQSLPGLRVPRWFDEGYAQWAAGWNRGDAWRLRIWVAMGRTPPLDSLSFRWPGDRASAEGAYLVAATTVEYLVSASGEEALALFIRRWREGGRFDEALRRVYGVTSAQLEEDWRGWLKERYGWLSVLGQSTVAWLLLAVLLLLMVRIRRRRNVERVAALRAGEPPDAPAWWDPAAPPTTTAGPGGRRTAGTAGEPEVDGSGRLRELGDDFAAPADPEQRVE